MKLKQLTEAYGIRDIQVRYYVVQGLLPGKCKNPERYDFTDEDIRKIREMTALRYLGVGMEDIVALEKGECTLRAALEKAVGVGDAQSHLPARETCKALLEADGALPVEVIWQKAKEDPEGYWPLTSDYEEAFTGYGAMCAHILKKVTGVDVKAFKHPLLSGLLLLLLTSAGFGFLGQVTMKESFWSCFLIFPSVLLIVWALMTPLYFINKCHPRLAGKLASGAAFTMIACLVLVIAVVIVLVILGLCSSCQADR